LARNNPSGIWLDATAAESIVSVYQLDFDPAAFSHRRSGPASPVKNVPKIEVSA